MLSHGQEIQEKRLLWTSIDAERFVRLRRPLDPWSGVTEGPYVSEMSVVVAAVRPLAAIERRPEVVVDGEATVVFVESDGGFR